MKKVIVKNEKYHYTFDPFANPEYYVDPGDTIEVYTQDAYSGNLPAFCEDSVAALKDVKYYNPCCGPIYVNGAEPGDTLVVHIDDIEFTRDWGVNLMMSYFGGLTSTASTRTLQPSLGDKVYTWELSEDHKEVYCKALDKRVPVDPFWGTIATAPEIEAVIALAPGPFGGNMDAPGTTKPGNTLYLPIKRPGAMLYIGDCHAVQGNGELNGSAVEITGKGTFRIDLIKGKSIAWPRVESKDSIMVIGSARPMEDAARIAYAELIGWMEEYGIDKIDAYALLSLVGKLSVGNMVDTNYSLVAAIDKKYL